MFPFLKNISRLEAGLIVTVMVLLIVISVLLVQSIQSARKDGVFQNPRPMSEILLKNKQARQISIKDVELIDTWMTFQYINFLFNIPDSYLKDTLQITDARYPKLPIGRYIKSNKLDRAGYMSKIKEVVREYLGNHPIK